MTINLIGIVIHVRMFTALHQMVTDAHGSLKLKKKEKKKQRKQFLVAHFLSVYEQCSVYYAMFPWYNQYDFGYLFVLYVGCWFVIDIFWPNIDVVPSKKNFCIVQCT